MTWGDRIRRAVRALRTPSSVPEMFEAGAFYSPLVDTRVVLDGPDRDRIWPSEVPEHPGLDLRPTGQLALLERLAAHRPPARIGGDGWEYDPGNSQFPPVDAALLYSMIGHLRPQRIVEVGSGWSTTVTAAAIQDRGLATNLTCIEPYPSEVLSRIGVPFELRVEKVENTPPAVFDSLEAGDILFIDTSHVVKTGSDVVHEFLHVVPRLAPGVVVHVHDIFIPEDYPQDWVRQGFNWNEQYLLHALLVGNQRSRVLAGSNWLRLHAPVALESAFGAIPLRGSSFWFEPCSTQDAVG